MKSLYLSHAMSNHGNKMQLFDFILDNEIQMENYLKKYIDWFNYQFYSIYCYEYIILIMKVILRPWNYLHENSNYNVNVTALQVLFIKFEFNQFKEWKIILHRGIDVF